MTTGESDRVIQVINDRINNIRDDIRESRGERRQQFEEINKRLDNHGERIRAIELEHAEHVGKHKNNGKIPNSINKSISGDCTTDTWLGSFRSPKIQATGLAAVLVAIAVILASYQTYKMVQSEKRAIIQQRIDSWPRAK